VTIATSPAIAHVGDVVNWTVLTSPDVSAVSAHVYLYTIVLHRMDTGHFAITFAIPHNVPAIFHGRYRVTVTATNPAGRKARGSFVLEFR
jgi:predicted secreted protein